MTICEMPQITRFLGPVLSASAAGKREARVRSRYSIVTEMLEQLDGYDHIEMTLDTECSDLVPFLASGFEVKVHPTILLDCKPPREELWAGLRDKSKNVIRRARETLTVRDTDDIDQFVHCYRTNLDGQESHFDLSLLPPAFAAARARQQGKIVAAVDSHGVAHAQVFFIWDDKYVYYFLSTRDKSVAHLGAVSLLYGPESSWLNRPDGISISTAASRTMRDTNSKSHSAANWPTGSTSSARPPVTGFGGRSEKSRVPSSEGFRRADGRSAARRRKARRQQSVRRHPAVARETNEKNFRLRTAA